MPYRLIDLADKLKALDLSNAVHLEEHQWRSVVNRAYYAAFLTARAFCDHKGWHANGSSHDRVINALRQQRPWAKTANQLQQIKTLRHKADYEWHKPVSERDARKVMQKSREIINALQGP